MSDSEEEKVIELPLPPHKIRYSEMSVNVFKEVVRCKIDFNISFPIFGILDAFEACSKYESEKDAAKELVYKCKVSETLAKIG